MATLAPAPGEKWRMGGGVGFSLSPNGRRIAIVSGDSLLVRSLDSLGSQPVRSTKGATRPFWSPDGQSIGFFADLQLKIVDLTTGAVRGLCPATRPSGGTWGEDGTILYMADPASGLHRTRPSGAACEKLNIALPADALDGQPYFLPDGKHFVYTSDLSAYLGDVTKAIMVLLTRLPRAQAVFAAPDYLLFTPIGSPQQSLFAQRIDVRSQKLVGDQTKVFDRVRQGSGYTSVAASAAGTLIAEIRTSRGGTFLNHVATGDHFVDSLRIKKPSFGTYRVSRDGRRIVFSGFELQILDLDRAVTTTLINGTRSGTLFQNAQWSPLDTAIAYRQREALGGQLMVVNVATGASRILPNTFPITRFPRIEDWSADGRYLACVLPPADGAPNAEAWIYELQTGKSRRLFDVASEASVRFAPNGRSIAYEFGDVVYVRPFPDGGTPIRVSPQTGRNPRWRADSKELLYIDGTGAIVAVPVDDNGSLGAPVRTVVPAATLGAVTSDPATTDFEPSPDGKLLHITYSTGDPATLTVLTNWWKHAGVQRR